MMNEKVLDKQDAAEIKNYTRTPNMLIFGYRDISPQEKWLYVCLKHMCGKRGTRHLSLRYISEQTGISTGALSKSKDKNGRINEGMIAHLHQSGLIHAEIKKHEGRGNPQYHITITDIWQLNQSFFETCSDFGQDKEEDTKPVRNSDEPVQISDTLVRNLNEPVRNPVQYQDYIQDDNKTRLQNESIANAIAPRAQQGLNCFDENWYYSLPMPLTFDEALTYLRPHGPIVEHSEIEILELAHHLWREAHEQQNDERTSDRQLTDIPTPIERQQTPTLGPVPPCDETALTSPPIAGVPSTSNEKPDKLAKLHKTKTPVEKRIPKAATPSGPPTEPDASMAWGTRKCLAWFDYWRGAYLIGKFKLQQASTCAKGLAEQYSEEVVLSIRDDMLADPYWIAQGGCDVCNVANNITKYLRLREAKKRGVIMPPVASKLTSDPEFIARNERNKARAKAQAEEIRAKRAAKAESEVAYAASR